MLLCQQLATSLEEARLYAESRVRGREAIRLSTGLALLNRASRALHRTLDVEPMLDAALRELGRAFGAAGVLLSLAPDAGRPARSISHWLSEAHGRDVTLRPTASVSRLVRDTGKPLVLSDIAERRDIVHPAHFRRGVKSLAAFPILGQRQRVLGVLFLYYTTTQLFPEREVQLLTAYADQLATALENARLYAETRTQETRLTQIFDSTSDGIMLVAGARRISGLRTCWDSTGRRGSAGRSPSSWPAAGRPPRTPRASWRRSALSARRPTRPTATWSWDRSRGSCTGSCDPRRTRRGSRSGSP